MKLASQFLANYPSIYYPGFDTRIISAKTVQVQLERIRCKSLFETVIEGYSTEDRPIFSLKFGHGATKVMMWSQMHGNESTATRALLDLFNFIEWLNQHQPKQLKALQQTLTIVFVPLLNPDGAQRYTRENALGIDINRDAKAKQSREARLLWHVFDTERPQYGFNLHDQRNFYHVSGTDQPASISFLAPALDAERSVVGNRKEAMQLVASMQQMLPEFGVPQGAALYNDEFYPTAFGDAFQQRGCATVLIESGAKAGDTAREEVRKITGALILHALEMVMTKRHLEFTVDQYLSIPKNGEKMMDLMVRNVNYNNMNVDLGINGYFTHHASKYQQFVIERVGDLSNFFALQTIDAQGAKVVLPEFVKYQLNADSERNEVHLITQQKSKKVDPKLALSFKMKYENGLLGMPATFDLSSGLKIRNGYVCR